MIIVRVDMYDEIEQVKRHSRYTFKVDTKPLVIFIF